MPFQKGNKLGGRSPDVAEWRKGPTAKKLRELSYHLLGDAVQFGFIGYQAPVDYRNPGEDSTLAGKWVYEQVEPKDRIAAAKELIDRTDGKAPQAITGEDGGPLKIDGSEELLRVLERLASGK